MSVFILKVIAIIAMVFDHAGYLIYHHFSWMNCIGRLAFPIFAFLITEGYSHTKNLKHYFLRLFLFSLLSQIPYVYYIHSFGFSFSLNILFTLLLGLLAIDIYEKFSNQKIGMLFVIFCCVLAHFAYFDYGWFGIACIFVFYFFKKKKVTMLITFALLVFINYFPHFIETGLYEYWMIIFCCLLSMIPLSLYNGLKGKNFKYFFYFFYPVHLLLLYMINCYIN